MIAVVLAVAMLAAGEPRPGHDVADMAWLAGSWVDSREGVTTRESWRLSEGRLVGVGETVRAGKAPQVEHMTITREAAGLTFTATLPGRPPVAFVRRPGPAGEAVFENPDHDFPQRVIYHRCGERLCARIEGTLNGKAAGQDWRYTRVK